MDMEFERGEVGRIKVGPLLYQIPAVEVVQLKVDSQQKRCCDDVRGTCLLMAAQVSSMINFS